MILFVISVDSVYRLCVASYSDVLLRLTEIKRQPELRWMVECSEILGRYRFEKQPKAEEGTDIERRDLGRSG